MSLGNDGAAEAIRRHNPKTNSRDYERAKEKVRRFEGRNHGAP